MNNKKKNPLLLKSTLRIIGLLILLIAPFVLAFFINNNNQLIAEPKEGGFFDVALWLLDLVMWVIFTIPLFLGLLLWTLGISNNPTISSFEKNVNKFLWFLALIGSLLALFFLFG